jgi:hypothetical protein
VPLGAWPSESPHARPGESGVEIAIQAAMQKVGMRPDIAHAFTLEAEAIKIRSVPGELVRAGVLCCIDVIWVVVVIWCGSLGRRWDPRWDKGGSMAGRPIATPNNHPPTYLHTPTYTYTHNRRSSSASRATARSPPCSP